MKFFYILVFIINFNLQLCYITNEFKFFLGNYRLRKSNDAAMRDKITYLQLNENCNIKVRSIINEGLFATKISRSGKVKLIRNNYKILNIKKLLNIFLNNFKMIDADNEFDLELRFNIVNEYSYSFIGIEFPEIRTKNNPYYNKIKKINVKQKGYTLYIEDDNNNYYIFDLENSNNKLPFIETAFTTLLFSDLITHIIDLLFSNIHI